MNTPNQTRKTPTIHTTFWVALSILSAIGGLVILITVVGFKIVPMVLAMFLLQYIILIKGFGNND